MDSYPGGDVAQLVRKSVAKLLLRVGDLCRELAAMKVSNQYESTTEKTLSIHRRMMGRHPT